MMMNWDDPGKPRATRALQSAIMDMLGRVLRNQGDQIDQCAKCNAPVERRDIDAGRVIVGRYEQGHVRLDIVTVDADDPTTILPDDYDPKRKGWLYQCPECGHVDGWPWKGSKALL